jgi:serine/threonine protein kinase
MDRLPPSAPLTLPQGTLSHMGPETILQNRITKASDVYAFGITLWELFTGARPFAGVPTLLLAQKVSETGLRPQFPSWAPPEYAQLAQDCWAQEPRER